MSFTCTLIFVFEPSLMGGASTLILAYQYDWGKSNFYSVPLGSQGGEGNKGSVKS